MSFGITDVLTVNCIPPDEFRVSSTEVFGIFIVGEDVSDTMSVAPMEVPNISVKSYFCFLGFFELLAIGKNFLLFECTMRGCHVVGWPLRVVTNCSGWARVIW